MADHQKTPIARDWENRDFNETVSLNLRKLLDFVNKFGLFFLLFLFSAANFPILLFFFCCWVLRSLLYVCVIDLSVRYKLGVVNEKLEVLERQVEYLETCYSTLSTNPPQ